MRGVLSLGHALISGDTFDFYLFVGGLLFTNFFFCILFYRCFSEVETRRDDDEEGANSRANSKTFKKRKEERKKKMEEIRMLLLLIVIGALSVVGAMAAPLYKPTAAAATGKNKYKMMACLLLPPPDRMFHPFPNQTSRYFCCSRKCRVLICVYQTTSPPLPPSSAVACCFLSFLLYFSSCVDATPGTALNTRDRHNHSIRLLFLCCLLFVHFQHAPAVCVSSFFPSSSSSEKPKRDSSCLLSFFPFFLS